MKEAEYEDVETSDRSHTLFSQKYQESYHSTKDGALNESLQKHVIPAMEHIKFLKKRHIRILDICFGLGYNTLATLYYLDSFMEGVTLEIYSPELDAEVLKKLFDFSYPREFAPYLECLHTLLNEQTYDDGKKKLELYIGDARVYIKHFDNYFDVIYQDPFSYKKNRELWSVEYFADIKKATKKDAILTTYSSATPVRASMHANGYLLYTYNKKDIRSGTIAFFGAFSKEGYTTIDMERKLSLSSKPEPIFDNV